MDVMTDLARSSAAFRVVVWPRISQWFGDGRSILVEGPDRRLLDTHAGIDLWNVSDVNGSMRGIASRVQFIRRDQTPYNTLTIRTRRRSGHSTELEKRWFAISNTSSGWLYPIFTIQAYCTMDGSLLLSAAGVRTALLIRATRAGLHDGRYTEIVNKDGSSSFVPVPWSAFENEPCC